MGVKRSSKLPRRKVGLALGAGAARGLAHIGVLEVLQREGIPIDMIAGTSAGALIGALYAQGKDISQIRNLAMDLGSKRFALLLDPALPKTGLVKGRKIKEALKSIIGDVEFKDLRIPFACVATDIRTGEEVVIKHGLVRDGVRASGSVPVILTAVKRQGRYLVDGALVNPIPVSVLKGMGADFIIAVNVIPNISNRVHQADERNSADFKEPNIFSVIMQTIHIATHQSLKSSLIKADIVIEPQVASIGHLDFPRIQECILQGELATQDSIPEIKRRLGGN